MPADMMARPFLENANEFAELVVVAGERAHGPPRQHEIDAWESEGARAAGALDAARTALADIIGWRADQSSGWLAKDFDRTASAKDGAQTPTFAGEEDGILRRLGAAVIMRWNTIPTKLQRDLFDNASSVGDLLQTGALKGQIARFLHKHKNDAGLSGFRSD